jgi:hypothetical protein
MYFIQQKQSGNELPLNLTPQMVPPTLRPKPLIGIDSHALVRLDFKILIFNSYLIFTLN